MFEIIRFKSLWGLCTEPRHSYSGQQDILLGLSGEAVAIAENSNDSSSNC